MDDLKELFEAETSLHWENDQGEPDIEYVAWLESRLTTRQESKPLTVEEIERFLVNMKPSRITGTAIAIHAYLPSGIDIEQLRSQFNLADKFAKSCVKERDMAIDKITSLTSELARKDALIGRMKPYMTHWDCGADNSGECDCKLDELLAELESPK